MPCVLRKLSAADGMDIYEMLQELPKVENGFMNGCYGLSFPDFHQWLLTSERAEQGIGLEDWQVPQSIFWLMADGVPVGIGKLRHRLSDRLRTEGGHCGYAIRPAYRNKGYGKLMLRLLAQEAEKLGLDKLLLTVQNDNRYSIRTALANGGVIECVSDVRHYIWLRCADARQTSPAGNATGERQVCHTPSTEKSEETMPDEKTV